MADGLINYGILDPKLGGSFSTGYREAEENRVQSEASQIKLDQLKQDRQMMTQFQQQLRSMGKNPDLGVIFDALIATGKPEYVAQGVEGHRRLTAQKEFAKIQGGASEVAPPPMMAQPPTNALAPVNALGSGTFGMEPTNALATPPAAPVNALAAQPSQIAQTESQIRKLMQFAASNPEMSTQAMAQARILQDQLELYSRRGQAESPDAVIMQRLGYPLTPEGFRAYNEAKRAPPPATKNIASVSPGDFTPASLATFNTSGNYGDLVLKPVDRAARPEAAVRTQQVKMDDGRLGIINMDTGVITPANLSGAPVKGQDASKTAVSEQQAAYNIGRLLTAANQIKDITGKDPSSMKPGATEALASSVGMSGTANLARPANRQIVQGAQRDALDALLYLATGAAYNKEQLLGQMEAYIPAFTDAKETVAAKQTRMADLIQSAKARAGKSWTPQMDVAMKTLMSPSKASGKVTPAAAPVKSIHDQADAILRGQ
jgi:hypothetical protein